MNKSSYYPIPSAAFAVVSVDSDFVVSDFGHSNRYNGILLLYYRVAFLNLKFDCIAPLFKVFQ